MPESEITLNIRKFDVSKKNNVTGSSLKRVIKYQDSMEKPALVVQITSEDPNAIIPAKEIDEITIIFNAKNKKIDDYIPEDDK